MFLRGGRHKIVALDQYWATADRRFNIGVRNRCGILILLGFGYWHGFDAHTYVNARLVICAALSPTKVLI